MVVETKSSLLLSSGRGRSRDGKSRMLSERAEALHSFNHTSWVSAFAVLSSSSSPSIVLMYPHRYHTDVAAQEECLWSAACVLPQKEKI